MQLVAIGPAWLRSTFGVRQHRARMKKLMPISFVCLALVSGCAHDPLSRGADGTRLAPGHGDVGRFILQKSIHYGCIPIRTNSLPEISTAWYYKEAHSTNRKHMLVVLSEGCFPTIVAFLHEAFGQPSIVPEDTGHGGIYGEYIFGMEHAYGQESPWIEFTCVGDRTQVDISALIKKRKELR